MRREVLSSELLLPILLPLALPSSSFALLRFTFTSTFPIHQFSTRLPLVQISLLLLRLRLFLTLTLAFSRSKLPLSSLLEITLVATPLLRVSLSLFFCSCVPPLLLLRSSYSASSALSSLPLLRGNLLLQCVSRSKVWNRTN